MLFLLNTTIMPNEGVYVNRKISIEEASKVLDANSQVVSTGNFPAIGYNFVSAIGHQGSADAFNSLFPGLDCKINRISATMQPGDEAIALKVFGRLQEGQILDMGQLNEIGFEFYYIQRLPVQSTNYIPEYRTYGFENKTL